MTDAAEVLSTAAKKLEPSERLELVEQLLDSLDAPDSAIDAMWAHEAEERLLAYRRGEIEAVSLAEVLAKHATS
jgi:putative addiction module component (TIGR02574 family)